MKRKLRIVFIAVILAGAPMLIMAQQPPHPNNGNAPTPGNNGPVGGGAPIGSGDIILLALYIVYSAGKLYKICSTDSYNEI
jgi:hypothetical protein